MVLAVVLVAVKLNVEPADATAIDWLPNATVAVLGVITGKATPVPFNVTVCVVAPVLVMVAAPLLTPPAATTVGVIRTYTFKVAVPAGGKSEDV